MASASSGAPDIIVWEWQENNDQWFSYDPSTCQKIEHEATNGKTRFDIEILMQSQGYFTKYEIDLSQKTQRSYFTNKSRGIRRRLISSTSSLANGYYWEWCQKIQGIDQWSPYPIELSEEIDSNFTQAKKRFAFPQRYNLPYEVNFKKKIQKNLNTGYKRPIRQSFNTHKYPQDAFGTNSFPNEVLPSSPTSSGATYPHTQVLNPGLGYPYLGESSSLSGTSGSSYPSSQHSGLSVAGSSSYPTSTYNMDQTTGFPGVTGSNNPDYLQSMHPNLAPMMFSSGNNSTSQFSSGVTPSAHPVPTTTSNTPTSPQSETTAAASAAKRKKSAPVHLPACPAGGIPCSSAASTGTVPVTQVLNNFTKKVDVDSKSTDQCAICQSNLTEHSGFGSSKETREMSLCQHVFHMECLEASYSHGVKNGCIVCSACNKTHGVKTGNQPDGIMRYSQMSTTLPGFSGCGTLRVEYSISSGVQKAGHPNPGRGFGTPGFPRIGYLPDNDDGRRVLLLLIKAWKRRLIFTVGQSSTTGRNDCVTWTGIHHKTEIHTNRGHGYPDDTYLDRVTAELEAEGVVDE